MEDSDDRSRPNRRIYGRGMFDGLKLAGVKNPGEVMNRARMKAIEDGLNGLTKKVLSFIPADRDVSVSDVIGFAREKGMNIEHRHVFGCVDALIDKGLVRGLARESFHRIPFKPVAVNVPAPNLVAGAVLGTPSSSEGRVKQEGSTDDSPLGRLASIEGRARELAHEIEALAGELSSVALDVEGYISRIRDDNAKVVQLKELLKSL